METFQDFLHIMDFNGVQTAQGPHENFSAAGLHIPVYKHGALHVNV